MSTTQISRLFMTDTGIITQDQTQNLYKMRYTRDADKDQLLDWQSAFYGMSDNHRLKLHDIYLTLSVESTAKTSLKGAVSVWYLDNNGQISKETESINIDITNISSSKIARVRYRPMIDACLAFSVGFTNRIDAIITPVVLLDCVVLYTPDAQAIIENVIGG